MATTMRIHSDHVGSLLRPPELLKARDDLRDHEISEDQLREIEDASILKALELQKQAGVEVFTDGEYRRTSFLDPLSKGIDGLILAQETPGYTGPQWQGPNSQLATQTMHDHDINASVVADKLRLTGRLTGGEGAFMKQYSPGPWKITMPGASLRANMMFRPGISDKFYPTAQDVTNELSGFQQQEVRSLLDEGVSYVQLDSLIYVGDAGRYLREGGQVQAFDAVIAADNAVIDVAKAGGATVGLHMCRGNNRSSWISEGNYEHLEYAFNQLHCDRFLLEYDTERSGGLEPLRFVPKDKMVVLGFVSTKVPQLESMDTLQRRIDEASKYVPLENLALSPQCGFASSVLGNLITWDDMQRKLELVRDTAQKIWG